MHKLGALARTEIIESLMSEAIKIVVNQYPFHLLPKIELLSKNVEEGARELTEKEKELLQSSFAWMQTYDGEKIPRLSAKTYSELWLLVRNLRHVQNDVRFTKSTHLRHLTKPHEDRYEATGQEHSFYEILNYDFSYLEEALFKCVEFEVVGK